MPRIIFLCGMPGSGKTTTAKKLAKLLNWNLIDLDNRIGEVTQKTPQQWITEQGEAAFREVESETLQQLIFQNNTIVAAGGGTPCFNTNFEWMHKNGTCIYLEVPLKALWNRVTTKDVGTRPLLGNEEEALQKLTELFEARKTIFEQIEWKESGISLNVKMLAEKIKNATH